MRAKTVILTLAAVALAGCSSAAEPSALPRATDSPSGTAAGSDVATDLPQDTATPRAPEALAFIDDYFRLVEQSIRSVNALDARRATFSETCDVCEAGAVAAQQLLESGLRAKGGRVTHSAELLEGGEQAALIVATHQIASIDLIDEHGKVVQAASPSEPRTQVFQLQRRDSGEWTILSIEELPSS